MEDSLHKPYSTYENLLYVLYVCVCVYIFTDFLIDFLFRQRICPFCYGLLVTIVVTAVLAGSVWLLCFLFLFFLFLLVQLKTAYVSILTSPGCCTVCICIANATSRVFWPTKAQHIVFGLKIAPARMGTDICQHNKVGYFQNKCMP